MALKVMPWNECVFVGDYLHFSHGVVIFDFVADWSSDVWGFMEPEAGLVMVDVVGLKGNPDLVILSWESDYPFNYG